MTLFQRAATRAEVPLAFSQGFNPHPKIAFGPALSVGTESEAEYLDMETDPLIDLLRTTKALNSTLPRGMRITEMRVVPRKAPSLSGSIGRYIYAVAIPAAYAQEAESKVRDFLSQPAVVITKDGKEKDIKPGIESMTVKNTGGAAEIEIILQDSERIKPRVQDVIEKTFGIGREESALFRVKRTAMFYKSGGRWLSPMDVA